MAVLKNVITRPFIHISNISDSHIQRDPIYGNSPNLDLFFPLYISPLPLIQRSPTYLLSGGPYLDHVPPVCTSLPVWPSACRRGR